MTPRSEEQLFEAFRHRGDTQALADLFDATAKELLRVAVHLSGELSDAEDLVQETYLAAIETAASWRPRQPVRAWLVGILHNRARRLFRDRKRRRRELAQPGSVPSAAETAARRDLRDTVRQAIATLAEPYRTVVGLHAQHGFTIAEIAATLERSQHTVRSQLTRGLDRVEPRLPDRAAVGAAPALLAMRQVVLERAAAQAVGAGASAGVGAGRWALLCAALLAVVIPVAWWVDGAAADPAPAAAGSAAERAPDRAPPPVIERRAPRVAADSGSAPRIEVVDPVRFCVLDRRTGEPVPGATVRYFGVGGFRQMDLSPAEFAEYAYLCAHDREGVLRRYGTSATTDADGMFVLDGLQSLGMITARKGELYGQSSEHENVIFVEPDRRLEVEVVDAAGAPAPGVQVRLNNKLVYGGGHNRYSYLGRTDARGRASIQHTQILAAALAAKRQEAIQIRAVVPGWRVQQMVPTARLGGVVRLQLPPSGSVRARVLDHAGKVVAAPRRRGAGLAVSLSGFDLRPSGADWVIDRVPLGERFDLQATLRGASCQRQVTLRRAGEERVVELRFGEGLVTHVGRALDPRGQPLANREIACHTAEQSLGSASLTATDDAGRFWLHASSEDASSTLHLQLVTVERERVGWDRRRIGHNASATVQVEARGLGVFQLGDVRFDPAPLLGRGRLQLTPPGMLDELIANRVRLQHKVGDRWRAVRGAAMVWGKAGQFEVFGRTAGAELRIGFSPILVGRELQDIGVAALEFRTGDMFLHFERRIAGDIALDVQALDPKLELKYEVLPAAGGSAVSCRVFLITRPASFGQLGVHFLPVLAPLPPGSYRVRIRGPKGGVLRELEQVEVRSGQRSRPMQDDPLDLRR